MHMMPGRMLVLLLLAGTGYSAEHNITLTVTPALFRGPVSFWTRTYNGSLPGPVIRVKQGDTLRIRLENLLLQDADGNMNTFRLPNTTNLHLHGMHVSPEGQADDVFRRVSPSSVGEYLYQIPPDHSPGLFWYHPHVHGSSSLQQGGGMAGAIVVEPSDPATIPPELAAMSEELLVFQHLSFHTDGKYQDPNPYINHLNVVKYSGDLLDPRPVYQFPDQTPEYLIVNGVWKPNISMAPGEFKLLRLVNAGVSAFLELEVVSDDQTAPPCDVYVISKDGIYVDSPYANQRPLLVPGGRVELAVRCNSSRVYSLGSAGTAPYHSQLEENTVVYEGTIAQILITGPPSPPMPLPGHLPGRPPYLADLTNSSVPLSEQFGFMFHTTGGPYPAGPPYPPMFINGQPFGGEDAVMVNVSIDSVQEWMVSIDKDESGSSNHPFHLHVNPFQIMQIGSTPGEGMLDMRVGEWRDTVPVPHFSPARIRFKPDRFTGTTMVHCHMTPHVDLGMGAVVNITQ